jgi:hypothetical protein
LLIVSYPLKVTKMLNPCSSPKYLRGCSMATSILHSQNFRFQIIIYLIGNWNFFSINTYICALNHGTHTSFSKLIFWKQIRMSLVLEYNWHETAVFTKHKHIILT